MSSVLRWWTCVLLVWTALDVANAASVLVAFKTADGGGLARVEIDDTGAVTKPASVLLRAPSFKNVNKLRVSEDGRKAVVNATIQGAPNLALVDLEEGPAMPPVMVSLDFEPDEMRFAKDRVFVGGSNGWVVAVDAENGTTLARWNAREQLKPPGHKAEDLRVVEPEGLLLVTLQKDGKKGRKGSRVVALGTSDLRVVSDHPLARDHGELHLSEKEAGPSPEVIEVDRASKTVLVTLDLYGAVMFAPLDAVIGTSARGGTVAEKATGAGSLLKDVTVLQTSKDGSWGTAFPDRVALVKSGPRTFAFVSNASADGGIAVFDVAARKRVGFLAVEAGCDYFVTLGGGKQLATVVSGKVKKRGTAEVIKAETAGGTDLLLIDTEKAGRGDDKSEAVGTEVAGASGAEALKRIPLGAVATRISGVAGSDRLVAVALALAGAANADSGAATGVTSVVVIYDTVALREVARVAMPGAVVGLATAR